MSVPHIPAPGSGLPAPGHSGQQPADGKRAITYARAESPQSSAAAPAVSAQKRIDLLV